MKNIWNNNYFKKNIDISSVKNFLVVKKSSYKFLSKFYRKSEFVFKMFLNWKKKIKRKPEKWIFFKVFRNKKFKKAKKNIFKKNIDKFRYVNYRQYPIKLKNIYSIRKKYKKINNKLIEKKKMTNLLAIDKNIFIFIKKLFNMFIKDGKKLRVIKYFENINFIIKRKHTFLKKQKTIIKNSSKYKKSAKLKLNFYIYKMKMKIKKLKNFFIIANDKVEECVIQKKFINKRYIKVIKQKSKFVNIVKRLKIRKLKKFLIRKKHKLICRICKKKILIKILLKRSINKLNILKKNLKYIELKLISLLNKLKKLQNIKLKKKSKKIIINKIERRGDKSKFFERLIIIKNKKIKNRKLFYVYWLKIIKNILPVLINVNIIFKGEKKLLPFFTKKKSFKIRKLGLSCSWIKKSICERKEKSLFLRIVSELDSIRLNTGNSINLKKKYYQDFYDNKYFIKFLKRRNWT